MAVNSSDLAVGFYQKVGFVQIGNRFNKYGSWATPMKWSNKGVII
ncbi:MAG: GNAT family N-acetyltransferase [Xenococcaceae cyanobacterium]